ncbi:MAG: HEPN domain-containing protein [Candidatus Omnitrophica bacterium]|nr:HEPN domain-containing protein [Candidatus Omnitrophota bacterium]
MKEIKELIKYWVKTSRQDYGKIIGLFNLKRYPDCLFYGHMVLEKILKALVVQNKNKHPEPIHNLLVLLEETGIKLEKEEIEFLAEVNKFNIRARYPDYKLSFYKLCTYKYTKPRLEKIKSIYKKLCQMLKD